MTDPVLAQIDTWLERIRSRPLYVGFSGGLDSRVLLHALGRRVPADQLIAIHVHHGLNDRADAWQAFCRETCLRLGCRLVTGQTRVRPDGQGVEAAARTARYRVFDDQVAPGRSLWLAHHLDDQLETFLLRLLRGSGPHGLGAMADDSERGRYRLLRPFLGLSRSDLAAYARAQGLDWIEDDSNADTDLDRNYLRHEILPRVARRWPRYRQTLNRSLTLIGHAARRDDDRLARELDHRLAHDGAFKAVQLDDWPEDDITALLHLWLRRQGVPAPSGQRLRRIVDEVVRAQPDARPCVRLGDGSVRRFRTALYWVPDVPTVGEPPAARPGPFQSWPGVGAVALVPADSGPDRIRADLPDLHWRMRRGGETLWPVGRAKRRDLKRLLQEYRLPPWVRDRLPLLYAGDRLIAVADLCVDRDGCAGAEQAGYTVRFQSVFAAGTD